MPEKSLQVTRLRLVTWKDFSGIRDLQKPVLALPPHSIGSLLAANKRLQKYNNGHVKIVRKSSLYLYFILVGITPDPLG